jgi:hypothetical protein
VFWNWSHDKKFHFIFILYLFSIFICFCFYLIVFCILMYRGRRGRDRMVVVGFTTTCAISVYHHKRFQFEPHSWRGVLDTTLCDKICQWFATRRCFLRILQFPPPIKLSRYHWNIVERCKIDTPNIQIHDHSISWLDTCTSIKSIEVKLVLRPQTSHLSEMMRSCRCFPHYLVLEARCMILTIGIFYIYFFITKFRMHRL